MDPIETKKEESVLKKENQFLLPELHEKVIKVTEALYRITDLFSDREPLKWSLRESGVKILSAVSCLDERPTYDELRGIQLLQKDIEALFYKINLAASGTFIARSNFDVLTREYKTLQSHLSGYDVLGLSFPVVSPSKALSRGNEAALPGYPQIAQTDISDNESKQTLPISLNNQTKSVKNVIVAKSDSSSSNRKDKIMQLLKECGPSGVGDLTKLLETSISEKTVQRDLNRLFEEGLVRKEGEKRWRRYFL